MSERAGRLQQFIADVENAAARFDMLPQDVRDAQMKKAHEAALKQFFERMDQNMRFGSPLLEYLAANPIERVPTLEEQHGITPGIKLWAKEREVNCLMEKWSIVFAKLPEDEQAAWDAMAAPHWDELPYEGDVYDDDSLDYQPSIEDLVKWREREQAKIAAAKKLGLQHKTSERMLGYYNEQVELAKQLSPLHSDAVG